MIPGDALNIHDTGVLSSSGHDHRQMKALRGSQMGGNWPARSTDAWRYSSLSPSFFFFAPGTEMNKSVSTGGHPFTFNYESIWSLCQKRPWCRCWCKLTLQPNDFQGIRVIPHKCTETEYRSGEKKNGIWGGSYVRDNLVVWIQDISRKIENESLAIPGR